LTRDELVKLLAFEFLPRGFLHSLPLSCAIGDFQDCDNLRIVAPNSKSRQWPTQSLTTLLVKLPRSIAVFLLASERPVPISWLLRHGPVWFWGAYRRGALPVAVPAPWGVGDATVFGSTGGAAGLPGSLNLMAAEN
jgi:hypothetical protein